MAKMGKIPILALLLLTGFLNLFLFHAYGFTAFVLQSLAVYLYLIIISFKKPDRPPVLTVVISSIIFGLTVLLILWRVNEFIQVILCLAILTELTVFTYLIGINLPFVRSLLELVLIPFNLGQNYLATALNFTLNNLSRQSQQNKSGFRSSPFFSILVGLIIGLPIVYVLGAMFSSADPVFAVVLRNTFSAQFFQRVPIYLLFSLFVIVALAPLIVLKIKQNFVSPLTFLQKFSPVYEMATVMTMVAIIIGAFLIIQAPYVFVNVPAETSLSQFGVATYSEYVKKGFTELLFISAFIYLLIWAGLVILRGKSDRSKKYLRWTQLVVLGEFFIFLISIFRRLWLYQSLHGLSLIRIYGAFFLVWMCAIAITLFLRHFYQKRWVVYESFITIIIFIIFSFFNAESFIANVSPPTVNKRIDYVYLSRMSADGYDGWLKAFNHASEVLTQRGYETKELLNREDRREVAYAGLILFQLMKNYDGLNNKYAGFSDWKKYQQDYYAFLINTSNNEMENINNRQFSSPEEKDSLLTSLKQTHELLLAKQKLADLASTKNYNLGCRLYIRVNSVDLRQPSFGYYMNPNPNCDNYYPHQNWAIYDPTTPDYWFTWNGRLTATFPRMQNDMPFTKISPLLTRFFELYEKITRQPESERDYDTDISFDTPFL